jgi:hypothetical protein
LVQEQLAPLQEFMVDQHEAAGEEHIAEVLDDFATSAGVELSDEVRADAVEAASRFYELCLSDPEQTELGIEAFAKAPEAFEAAVSELEQNPALYRCCRHLEAESRPEDSARIGCRGSPFRSMRGRRSR